MLNKIARMRSQAPYELPKTRLCVNVVGTILAGGSAQEVAHAVELLQAGVGPSWSVTQALQFLSGRQAEFAIECAPADQRPTLYAVHLVAKSVCDESGLASVQKVDGIDFAKLQAIAKASADHVTTDALDRTIGRGPVSAATVKRIAGRCADHSTTDALDALVY